MSTTKSQTLSKPSSGRKKKSFSLRGFLRRFREGQFPIFLTGLGMTFLVMCLYMLDPAWLRFQEFKIYDQLLKRSHAQKTSGVPIIVDIDEKSLAEIGQWPWPRYRIALLLAGLQQAGAAAVGLDTLLAEPDRTSPSLLAKEIREELDPDFSFIGLPKELEDFDKVLADILRQGPFALGYYFEVKSGAKRLVAAQDTLRQSCELKPMNLTLLSEPGARDASDSLFAADSAVCPLPALLASARSAGYFNAVPDSDNILRRVPLLIGYNNNIQPSLALATAIIGLDVKMSKLEVSDVGVKSLTLHSDKYGERKIPLDEKGQMLLNYRGPGKTFPYISARDVLKNSYPDETFKDKVVFVGTSAAALKDSRATPLDRVMPGVEVHATVVDTIVNADYILRPDWAKAVEILLILVTGLASAALLSWTSAKWLLLPFVGLSFLLWETSAYAMSELYLFISPLDPLIIIVCNFVALTFLKFWREERKRRFIHTAFSQYVDPQVVKQIVESPDKLKLTGEEKTVSILFSDVRGFTTISEKLNPSQVVELLHNYFTPMTKIITQNSGTLDKFIGDAIMAFWNAPLQVPEHCDKALISAISMIESLNTLNAQFKDVYGFKIDIGIGLHSGSVRVGNFGSNELFNYTIIGDSVNLCSRLEGLTKYYGKQILVSDSLVNSCDCGVKFQEIDKVKVKGKKKPVTIYTPVVTAVDMDEIDVWENFIKQYKDKNFKVAQATLQNNEMKSNKLIKQIYIKRCGEYIANPPAEDWDGVFTHESK